jgi:hypothetical protein
LAALEEKFIPSFGALFLLKKTNNSGFTKVRTFVFYSCRDLATKWPLEAQLSKHLNNGYHFCFSEETVTFVPGANPTTFELTATTPAL